MPAPNALLDDELEGWVRGSRRFREFADRYRSKIGAKLKNARSEEALWDVRAELETAALLLSEARFTLEYEKYAAGKLRGPDFTVTFKTHTPFNVEVRRVRVVEFDDGGDEARVDKLVGVLCEKVRQMPPSIANLLWLASEADMSAADLAGATARLRQLAESKDEAFFTRRGFASAASFLKQYRQLSGIVLRQSGETKVWLNPLARHKAPPDVVRAIERLGVG